MSYELSTRHYLAYSLPVITFTCLMGPINILQGIYAKYYGIPLTVIASILLLCRLFDAVLDPLVGYLSDRYCQHFGTYNPIILTGSLLFLGSSYFLYMPPINVDALYLAGWLLVFYFAWTLFEIPHLAWASRLAKTSVTKAKIYSFRIAAGYTGLLLFYAIPLLPIFESRDITPETLRVLVMVVIILALPFLMLCLKTKFKIPRQVNPSNVQKAFSAHTASVQKSSFSLSLVKNKSLTIFLVAYLLIFLSSGMWYSLIFLYVDVYLGLGDQFSKMFLLAFIVGIGVTPIWYKLSVYLGKKSVWILATLLMIISYIFTGYLSPGEAGATELIILKTIQTLGFTCMGVVAPAMLSEIIDYSNWKNRSDNSATYFAIYTFTSKTSLAIATALGLFIAGWYGFDATASSHNEHGAFGLTLAMVWLPSLLGVLSLPLILLSPIDERGHQIICRRLEAIAARNRNKRNVIEKEGVRFID